MISPLNYYIVRKLNWFYIGNKKGKKPKASLSTECKIIVRSSFVCIVSCNESAPTFKYVEIRKVQYNIYTVYNTAHFPNLS